MSVLGGMGGVVGWREGRSKDGSEIVSIGEGRRMESVGLGSLLGRGVGRLWRAGVGWLDCVSMGDGTGVGGSSCCIGAKPGELGGDCLGVLCASARSRVRRWSRLDG